MNLSDAARIVAEVARETDGPGDERLEVRADGALLATIAVPGTGDRYAWTTVEADLVAPIAGVHDLRLVLHGTFRLAAFRFTAPLAFRRS